MKFLKNPFFIIVSVWLVLLIQAVFFGYLNHLDDRLRGEDPIGYFVYLPSIIFDHDVNFSNNYQHIYGYKEGDVNAYAYRKQSKTGYYDNPWSIGPAIAWSPFYLLAHGIGKVSNIVLGTDYLNDGYSGLYSRFIMIACSVYVLFGCFFCYLFCCYFVPKPYALGATIIVLLGSQLTYYNWSWLPMSHSLSFCFTALYLMLYKRLGTHQATALSAGIMILIRWQNALFLIPQICINIYTLYINLKQKHYNKFKLFFSKNALFALVVIVSFIPQSYTWKKIYGSFLTVPQRLGHAASDGSVFNFSELLNLINVLFHLDHGLFSWHPLLLLGLIGIGFAVRNKLPWSGWLLVLFIAQWILNGVWGVWSGGGFGQRKFTNLLPVFAVGLGYLILHFKSRIRLFQSLMVIIGCLVIWNGVFQFQYFHHLVPENGPLLVHEYIWDKFNIVSAYKADEKAKKAIVSLTYYNNKYEFVQLSKSAFQTYPYNRKVISSYMFSTELTSSRNQRQLALQKWQQMAPKNAMAKISRIRLEYSKKNYNQVSALLNDLNGRQIDGLSRQKSNELLAYLEYNFNTKQPEILRKDLYYQLFRIYLKSELFK